MTSAAWNWRTTGSTLVAKASGPPVDQGVTNAVDAASQGAFRHLLVLMQPEASYADAA
jgi:hypothetical protein